MPPKSSSAVSCNMPCRRVSNASATMGSWPTATAPEGWIGAAGCWPRIPICFLTLPMRRSPAASSGYVRSVGSESSCGFWFCRRSMDRFLRAWTLPDALPSQPAATPAPLAWRPTPSVRLADAMRRFGRHFIPQFLPRVARFPSRGHSPLGPSSPVCLQKPLPNGYAKFQGRPRFKQNPLKTRHLVLV